MKFSTPRTNAIESDAGFSVEVLGRTGIRYTEGNRSLLIDSELLAGPSALAIYSNSIKNESVANQGSTAVTIDVETKARIIENITAAFKFRGIDIQAF